MEWLRLALVVGDVDVDVDVVADTIDDGYGDDVVDCIDETMMWLMDRIQTIMRCPIHHYDPATTSFRFRKKTAKNTRETNKHRSMYQIFYCVVPACRRLPY